MQNRWLQLGCVCVMVLISLGIGVFLGPKPVPSQDVSQIGSPHRSFPAGGSDPEIMPVSHKTLAATTTAPQIVVHVWMVEFIVTSPNASVIGTEFDASLQAAIKEFNSQSSPQSSDFVASDTLAALAAKFNSKGKVTIHDESPRVIANGETDSWGTTISISATPTLQPSDGRIRLTLTVAHEDAVHGSGVRTQTALDFRPGQVLSLGGGAACVTETKPVFPQLGQIPKVGSWLSLPVTRTRSWNRRFLASATIVPESQARNDKD